MESTARAAKAAAYDTSARRLSEIPSGPMAQPVAQAARDMLEADDLAGLLTAAMAPRASRHLTQGVFKGAAGGHQVHAQWLL